MNHDDILYGLLPDDFPENRPGGPQGENFQRGVPLSEWGMLMRGKTVGKSCVLREPTTLRTTPEPAQVDLLELKGDDEYALGLGITLLPMLVSPSVDSLPDNLQNVQSFQDVAQLLDSPLIGWVQGQVIVQWGIGGIGSQAIVDVNPGTIINLQASWVRLRAQIVKNENAPRYPWQFRAFVGPGVPKMPNATCTVPISTGVLAQAESDPLPIPNFATRAYISSGVDAPATTWAARIKFWGSSTPTLIKGDYFQSSNNPLPAPIPGGAQYFTVLNESGAGIDMPFTRVVFELGI